MRETGIGNKEKPTLNRRGFTLIEVMVAFTILTIGLLAVMPVTIFMTKANIHNKHFINARMLAEQYSERIRTFDYDASLISDDGDTSDLNNIANPDHGDTLTMDNTNYFIFWNVKERANPQGMKEINVIVVWDDPVLNERRQVSTLTYKAAVSR